ncbi:hypothetical protein VTI74DRAFT_6453 [Chaetomium olivicolor]
MRLLTALAALAATVVAMPIEAEQSDVSFVKRASCAVEFPEGCVKICCKQAGGCLALSCAKSYCHYFNVGQPECICKCSYG